MAEKRMFAKSIVLSDAFLDMPMSARCLYFTLGMLADDDGFVGAPKSIMRQCGASQDDLSVLISKRYVLAFESGVIVIKHWRINNYLRNDRHIDTTYIEERDQLTVDSKGAYTEAIGIPPDNQVPTNCPSPGIPSIEKSSKDLEESNNNPPISPQGDGRFDRFWAIYPKKVGKGAARKAFAKAIRKCSVDNMIAAVEKQKQSSQWTKDNGQYIPNPATWLNQERWDDRLDEEGGAAGGDAAGNTGHVQSKWNLHSDLDK